MDSAAVMEVLGLAGNLQTAQLLENILRRDAQAALLLLDRLYQSGKDVGAVLGELSVLVRDLLLRRTAPEGGAALLSGGYDSATLDRLGGEIPTAVFSIWRRHCKKRRQTSITAQTAARMQSCVCWRLCDESLSGDVTALVSRIQRLEGRGGAGQVLAKGRAPGTEEPTRLTAKDAPPWEETPAPQPDALTQADMSRPEEPEEQVLSVPEQPKEPSATNTVVGSGWWRALAESCKGRAAAHVPGISGHVYRRAGGRPADTLCP